MDIPPGRALVRYALVEQSSVIPLSDIIVLDRIFDIVTPVTSVHAASSVRQSEVVIECRKNFKVRRMKSITADTVDKPDAETVFDIRTKPSVFCLVTRLVLLNTSRMKCMFSFLTVV